MLKLIQLEIKKFKITGYVIGAFIAMACIFGFVCAISFDPSSVEDLSDFEALFSTIDLLTRGVFIVFAAVLLSRFIIEEYRTKSISVLFTYPINRKKLIIAKLLIVFSFTFISILIADSIVSILMLVINHYHEFIHETLTKDVVIRQTIAFLMNAIAASFMSLIPLIFGMRKYSTAATVVASILIVFIVCSNSNGFSLNSIIAIPITLSWIGAIIAYTSFRNIERKDINP
ncbi:ABC transporter permease [Paenibacillus sp. PR3]|uniref:ABC transporter permease n=1 Tax=Paenibacillus terricola TaxID=2763503 RepID=A0ABR8MPT5_9BACL|nr:ABC transporter permease [Paenibacillus terricola]MBD3917326.1 ABC transporter permease [Paenibacillus terricola]